MFCYDGKKTAFQVTAYVCPRCYTRATEIPTSCCTCGLQLNSSTHIARSHHHLFPVASYGETVVAAGRCPLPGAAGGAGGGDGVGNGSGGSSSSSSSGNGSNNGSSEGPSEKRSRQPRQTNPLGSCRGCLEMLTPGQLAGRCPLCREVFCVDCDIFVHDGLHVCPGCG